MASALTSQKEQMVNVPSSLFEPGVCSLHPMPEDQAVFGQLVSDGEGLLAFFLESTFLGLWLFGWDRLSRRVHRLL